MLELLLPVVIGVLVLVVLLLVLRARRSSGNPSESVHDFHRALSAMEPGAARGREEVAQDPAADVEPATEEPPAGGDGPHEDSRA